jgi:L-lysine 2,3-aminomutase
VATLCELSEQLFSHGVIPYYLHLLDKATGTGHFEVSETAAVCLINQVQATLPGYLVPKLVKEQAGALSKQIIF